jgi:hypothetical protein
MYVTIALNYSNTSFEIDLLLSILKECDDMRIQRNKDYPLVAMQAQTDESLIILSLQVMLLQRTDRDEEYLNTKMKFVKK